MKSVVTEKPCKQEIKYPCLKKYNSGRIVLFYKKSKGIVIVGDSFLKEGRETCNHESEYELFTGSVCLENDDD